MFVAIKKDNGKWRLDIRPNGMKGRRIVKVFDTKAKALQYQNQLLSGRLDTQGEQPFVDNRRLNDLIQIWYDLHGRSLKSSVDTKNRLFKLSELLRNPYATSVDSETLARYRKKRLDAGIASATLNRELITLKALYRELKRLGVIDYDSPILLVRKLREKKLSCLI